MILLDAVIAALLAVTVSYCWRLNRKIAGFRNAKSELEHMIRSFDSSIKQAYESIAVLKENSSDKNIQLIRDMEKVRFLANDLAFLVEKGEKLADSLEDTIRKNAQTRPVDNSATFTPRPRQPQPRPAQPLRQAAPQMAVPLRPQNQQAQPRIAEVQNMIDTLARSYVVEQQQQAQPVQQQAANHSAPPSLPPRNGGGASRPLAALIQPATPEQRAQAIEKVLSHMASRNMRNESSMPSVPPREMTQKVAAQQNQAAAGGAKKNPFFDSLRVVTPNE